MPMRASYKVLFVVMHILERASSPSILLRSTALNEHVAITNNENNDEKSNYEEHAEAVQN